VYVQRTWSRWEFLVHGRCAASRSSGVEAARQRQMVVSKRVYALFPTQEIPPLIPLCYTGNPRPSTLNPYLAFILQPGQTRPSRTQNRLCLLLLVPLLESLYDRLRATNNAEVGHTTDILRSARCSSPALRSNRRLETRRRLSCRSAFGWQRV
jgi:hypothetical protein